jgi:hypothetical protein
MGKRSNFERVPRDFYPTPYTAFAPIRPHLDDQACYIEPCAGDGTLETWMFHAGFWVKELYDIEPQRDDIIQKNVFDIKGNFDECVFITNPPWDRKILHPLIVHLSMMAPTWLLFDADWMHTKQSADLMKICVKIVSVGRVKWIEGSKNTGKDNCCWYLFDSKHTGPTEFYGR